MTIVFLFPGREAAFEELLESYLLNHATVGQLSGASQLCHNIANLISSEVFATRQALNCVPNRRIAFEAFVVHATHLAERVVSYLEESPLTFTAQGIEELEIADEVTEELNILEQSVPLFSVLVWATASVCQENKGSEGTILTGDKDSAALMWIRLFLSNHFHLTANQVQTFLTGLADKTEQLAFIGTLPKAITDGELIAFNSFCEWNEFSAAKVKLSIES